MNRSDQAIIIEFSQVGSYVKVSAFHEASMTEVSIVGDPRESEAHLKRTVLKKLKYVLNKSKTSEAEQNSDKDKGGRGIIV